MKVIASANVNASVVEIVEHWSASEAPYAYEVRISSPGYVSLSRQSTEKDARTSADMWIRKLA